MSRSRMSSPMVLPLENFDGSADSDHALRRILRRAFPDTSLNIIDAILVASSGSPDRAFDALQFLADKPDSGTSNSTFNTEQLRKLEGTVGEEETPKGSTLLSKIISAVKEKAKTGETLNAPNPRNLKDAEKTEEGVKEEVYGEAAPIVSAEPAKGKLESTVREEKKPKGSTLLSKIISAVKAKAKTGEKLNAPNPRNLKDTEKTEEDVKEEVYGEAAPCEPAEPARVEKWSVLPTEETKCRPKLDA